MKSFIRTLVFGLVAVSASSYGAGPPVGYIFEPDTPIRAQEVNSNFQELADRIALLEASLASAQTHEPVSFHYDGPGNAYNFTNVARRFVITDIIYQGGYALLSSTTRGYLVDAPISYGAGGVSTVRSSRDVRQSFATGIVIEPNETLQLSGAGAGAIRIMISGYYL